MIIGAHGSEHFWRLVITVYLEMNRSLSSMLDKTFCSIQRLSMFARDHGGSGEMPLSVDRVLTEESGIVVTKIL